MESEQSARMQMGQRQVESSYAHGKQEAPETTVDCILKEQAQSIAVLEAQLKELAAKLQPFVYDGPRQSTSGELGNQRTAPPPPMLSAVLSTVSANTAKIVAIGHMLAALREAVIR